MATLVDFNARDSVDNKFKQIYMFLNWTLFTKVVVPSNTLINESNMGDFSVATQKKSI